MISFDNNEFLLSICFWMNPTEAKVQSTKLTMLLSLNWTEWMQWNERMKWVGPIHMSMTVNALKCHVILACWLTFQCPCVSVVIMDMNPWIHLIQGIISHWWNVLLLRSKSNWIESITNNRCHCIEWIKRNNLSCLLCQWKQMFVFGHWNWELKSFSFKTVDKRFVVVSKGLEITFIIIMGLSSGKLNRWLYVSHSVDDSTTKFSFISNSN